MILGGSQENTVLSCEGQAREGNRVHLAFGPIYGPEGSLLARVEAFNARVLAGTEPAGATAIVTHIVPNLVREVQLRKDYKALGELEQLIARILPDVVHTHSSKAGILGRHAAYAVRRRGGGLIVMGSDVLGKMRIVHTIHGPPFMPSPTPSRSGAKAGLGARFRIGVNNYIYTLAERRAATRCDRIISVADAMTAQFLAKGIGLPKQFITIYSGMEVETFTHPPAGEDRRVARQELGVGPSDMLIGTVARLAENKGHDDLLDAVAPLLKARNDVKLLWIGDGWWRARLLARIRKLGLTSSEIDLPGGMNREGRVLLTGLVPPDRVPPLLRTLDLLVHPSAREGLPRAVPQALLCGVCPIAYDVDGTGEICREFETGRLVRLGDIEGLRAAITWALENEVARSALAERGKRECLIKFSVEEMIKELDKVYRERLD